MNRTRLPLNALRIFEVAARLQSFKQAADELSVTPTTVSNQIRQLEREWNIPLFERRTRQLLLTEPGRELSRVVSRAFDDIRVEVDAIVGITRKVVNLAVGPIFGSRWLIPRLSRFRRQHPDIELILHHSPRISSVDEMKTDIAIDWGDGAWRDLEFTHLFDIVYAPVVSPTVIDKTGDDWQVTDLLEYPIIHQYDRSEWLTWFKLAGIDNPVFEDETIITDSNVVTQAAIDGQGVALGIFPFIQGEVDSGRLLRPFKVDLTPHRAYHLLTRVGARQRVEIASVCNWLISEVSQSQAEQNP